MSQWGQQQSALTWLERLPRLLQQGNTAMQWIERHRHGESISAILRADAQAMARQEEHLLRGGLG